MSNENSNGAEKQSRAWVGDVKKVGPEKRTKTGGDTKTTCWIDGKSTFFLMSIDLNVSLRYLRGIRRCGITGAGVSLLKEMCH